VHCEPRVAVAVGQFENLEGECQQLDASAKGQMKDNRLRRLCACVENC
jgi:hypothetical protein